MAKAPLEESTESFKQNVHATKLDKNIGFSPGQIEAISGSAGGVASALAGHPLELIKTRLQIQSNKTSPLTNTRAVLSDLIKIRYPIQTVQNLYRGTGPHIIGNVTSWGFFFACKSEIQDQLLRWNRPDLRHDAGARVQSDLTYLEEAIAAGFSGTSVTLLTSPIWVLKTRMLSSNKDTKGAYTNMWQGSKHIYNTDGIKGFYKGLVPGLLSAGHGAVYFPVYTYLKKFYAQKVEGHEKVDDLSNTGTSVCTSAAKFVATMVTFPVNPIRTRMQTYDADTKFGRGVMEVSSNIWRERGMRGFWRGAIPHFLKVLPQNLALFMVYENVRKLQPHDDVMHDGKEDDKNV